MPEIETFTSIINQLLPEPHASLLSGMVFGVRRTMPREFYQALIDTGTLHVIALSGQNIAILINLIAVISLQFLSRKVSGVLTILFIVLFILFVGPEPPVVRAGLMAGLSLIAVYFGKINWSMLTLFLASGLMLLAHSEWISSISFQLSFGATLGIILFGNRKSSFINHPTTTNNNNNYDTQHKRHKNTFLKTIQNTLHQDIRLTLAAQVFTIPIILFYFRRVSLISPFANILIGWVVPMITIAGLGISILGFVWLPLAIVPSWIVWVPLTYFIEVVNLLAQIPFASLEF